MKKTFYLVLIFFLASCGSRDIIYKDITDPDILSGLKKRQQTLCLQTKSDLIQTWQNRWQQLYDGLDINDYWEFNYTVDPTSDGDDEKSQVIIVVKEKNTDSLTFIVQNEDFDDGVTTETKRFIYTKNNHFDHVNLFIVDSCIGSNVTNSDSTISFDDDGTNESYKYQITSNFVGFFGRYLSIVSELRSNDTDTAQGSVTSTMKLDSIPSKKTNNTLVLATPAIGDCTFSDIDFDDTDFTPIGDFNVKKDLSIISQDGIGGATCL